MYRYAIALTVALAACDSKPSEPTASAQTNPPPNADTPPTPKSYPPKQKTADPLQGKWTLADATAGIPGTGALTATIDTTKGKISCTPYDDKAPITVANFIGLSTGKRSWLDPVSKEWVNKPAYDGTTFHRVIKDFMIQGGDPKGDGSGEPGYVIVDELWPGGLHDRAGLLCMANRGPNTNGAQFFITDSDGPSVKNLDNLHSYTIFGSCTPVDVVHTIANVPKGPRDKPIEAVTINSVKIARASTAK
jgi:peptidyl-prolyl cis-trans isomerase A (cyclophilin A)